MNDTHILHADATARTPWARISLIAIILSLVVGVVLLAFAWPAVTAGPHDLPVGVVGTDQQVDQVRTEVDEQSDGAIALERYADRTAAIGAIERRDAYGAVVLGAAPTDASEVLTATAANAQVAQLLNGLANTLQTQLDGQVHAAVAAQLQHAQEAAAAQTQAAIEAAVQAALAGQTPAAPDGAAAAPIELPSVTVTVTDVAPYSDTDPRGAGLTAAMFPLVLGGMAGGIGLTLLVKGGRRRAVALVVYAVATGLVLAGLLQGLFGALLGSYWLNAAAISTAIAAIGSTITGLASVLGPAGAGVAAAFTLLIANPLSAATLPVEFLASPWGAVGQWLPPGAAATLMRDLSYFPDADVTGQWWLLVSWSLVGLALTVVDRPGLRLRAGASRRAHAVPA